MASAVLFNSILQSKFRGCMIGGLLGDCLGNEAYFLVSKNLSELITDLMSEENGKILLHTDDTRMTISVALSLIEKGEANAKDMAEKFVNEYYNQPKRGYGLNVMDVFRALRDSKFKDIFLPAWLQFNSSGSWGNGAAMRVSPITLFGNNRGEEYIMKSAKDCSLITHAHIDGYNGAILQCLAVNIALELDPSQELDPVWFIDSLLQKMENIEPTKIKPYCESLKKMKEYFLENQQDISSEEIAKTLGNGQHIKALKSVPPAIYAFLCGMKPLREHFQMHHAHCVVKYDILKCG